MKINYICYIIYMMEENTAKIGHPDMVNVSNDMIELINKIAMQKQRERQLTAMNNQKFGLYGKGPTCCNWLADKFGFCGSPQGDEQQLEQKLRLPNCGPMEVITDQGRRTAEPHEVRYPRSGWDGDFRMYEDTPENREMLKPKGKGLCQSSPHDGIIQRRGHIVHRPNLTINGTFTPINTMEECINLFAECKAIVEYEPFNLTSDENIYIIDAMSYLQNAIYGHVVPTDEVVNHIKSRINSIFITRNNRVKERIRIFWNKNIADYLEIYGRGASCSSSSAMEEPRFTDIHAMRQECISLLFKCEAIKKIKSFKLRDGERDKIESIISKLREYLNNNIDPDVRTFKHLEKPVKQILKNRSMIVQDLVEEEFDILMEEFDENNGVIPV